MPRTLARGPGSALRGHCSAIASDSRVSADQLSGAAREGRDSDSYSGSIVAAWELDLFGRVRRDVEAARADTRASALDLAALQVIIAGEVARSYLELRGLQERLRVARENADNQRETLQLVEVRLSAGRGTDFDTSRARAQLESTLARVRRSRRRSPSRSIASRADGQCAGALISGLDAPASLPTLPDRLDPGTPGELLRRRRTSSRPRSDCTPPHGIGVATADLFPRFTLTGLIRTQAFDSSALFEQDSETRSSRWASTGRSWTSAGCVRG
jgi:outer membrane protein TolC